MPCGGIPAQMNHIDSAAHSRKVEYYLAPEHYDEYATMIKDKGKGLFAMAQKYQLI